MYYLQRDRIRQTETNRERRGKRVRHRQRDTEPGERGGGQTDRGTDTKTDRDRAICVSLTKPVLVGKSDRRTAAARAAPRFYS